MKKVIIGGTFDLLHAGHKALLKRAFELGSVRIGLVANTMAEMTKGRKVADFSERKSDLENFIKNELNSQAEIFPLYDRFGPALEEDFDYIVTSPETYETAFAINKERKKLKKKPIEIVRIDYVLAQDGQPISSTRIHSGEIDRDGRISK